MEEAAGAGYASVNGVRALVGFMRVGKTIAAGFNLAGHVALGGAAVTVAFVALWSTFGARPAKLASASVERVSAPAPVWIDLTDASPRYMLRRETPFGSEPTFYSARRHAAGGGRLDQMVFGSSGVDAATLRLSIYQPLDEPRGAGSFWLEMARRAGEAGLALERAPSEPEALPTRLGAFEFGDIVARSGQTTLSCAGFRQISRSPDLTISGLACFGGQVLDAKAMRAVVTCALEGVSLAPGEDDMALKAFFMGLHPAGCPQRLSHHTGD